MRTLLLASSPWRFRDATKRSVWREAVVPGCVHRDLLRHGLIPDPFWAANESALQWIEERDWEYCATFRVPAELFDEEVIELVADGLDTVATVTLNGERVGETDNMFVGHRWDVTHLLRRGAANELLIRFGSAMNHIRTHRLDHKPRELNDPVGRCTVIRKQQCQFGWDWAPRLVTAGIWRDIRLEAWSGNRLESVRIVQRHEPVAGLVEAGPGSPTPATVVTLEFTPEFARPDPAITLRGTIACDGRAVAGISDLKSEISNPLLWWPNGQGAQPLHTIDLEAVDATGRVFGTWSRRIGLRTIVLDRTRDEWGESFRFVVNGRPVFAKGANWIPAHSFVAGLTRADYERDVRSAAQAHMNMLRVWGGGIYESEDFYDLCDELGLLVWQDFMFACTRYPADAEFLASARAEAGFQVRRLRHRACLALWCGNNEVFGCNAHEITGNAKHLADYEALFHRTLADAVAATDSLTAYWPSSPWRGDRDASYPAGESRGDTHYWDVWHMRHPVKDYEKYLFRFVSEFGMQSFSSPETQATFCPPEDGNIFGATMKNHQKNQAGNQIILDYISRRYRLPDGQENLLHLSQLNQAYCMQVGVEHWRRNMPRCMGALYWQLNDCWPVASWSSIEFTGRWKALHHVARRFFAPFIVSAHVPGDEVNTIGNYRRSTVEEVHLYTVCDAPEPAAGLLRWDLFHLDGRTLLCGRKKVELRYGESVCHVSLDLRRDIARHSRDRIYLRIALDVQPGASVFGVPASAGSPNGGRFVCVSEDTVFLAPPRYLPLPTGEPDIEIEMSTPMRARITFTSPVFLHRFCFDLRGVPHHASDNYFELYPGEPKAVVVDLDKPHIAARLRKRLTYRSLVDTC